VRFTTAELGEVEAKIANAGERALNLELEIFDRLTAQALAASDELRAAAHAFALLDVATALAKLAIDDTYVRPEVDASLGFAIEAGRHPVVEQALKRDGAPFIANSCDLSPVPPPYPPPHAGGGWGREFCGGFRCAQPTLRLCTIRYLTQAQSGLARSSVRPRLGGCDRFDAPGAAALHRMSCSDLACCLLASTGRIYLGVVEFVVQRQNACGSAQCSMGGCP
jgi:hypothetical protein